MRTQRWARTDLRTEVLEQFCDPRWFDLPLLEIGFTEGLQVLSENTNWTVTARRTDADLRELVLETAARKPVWSAPELAQALAITPQQVGIVLSASPVWTLLQTNRDRKRWCDFAAIAAWLNSAGRVQLQAASQHIGLPPRSLAKIARKTTNKQVRRGWIYASKEHVK